MPLRTKRTSKKRVCCGARAGVAGRITAALLATTAMASPALAQDEASKWGPSLDLEAALGTERSRGEVDAFWPLWQDGRAMLFADLRGKLFEDDASEGNFGLGYRRMLDGGWNLGGYGFFDLRSSENDNTFSQITVGAEALSVDWDLRANVYVPLDDAESAPGASIAELQGASLVVRAGEEVPLWGFDAEIGWRVPVFEPEDDSQLRVYAGGFHFDSDDVDDSVTGPRLRLEYRLHDLDWLGEGSRLTVSAEGQYDSERDTQATGALRLRIPLQSFVGGEGAGRPLTPIERRMVEPVVRDVDIVTLAGSFGDPEPAVNPATGLEFGNVVTVDGSRTLQQAIDEADDGGLIIAQGGAGDIEGGATMTDGQTLLGGGNSLSVRGGVSGSAATFVAPGSRPTVVFAVGTTPVIQVDSVAANIHISGLDIRGAGPGALNAGIVFKGINANATVSDNTISGIGPAGIVFGAVDGANVTGNTISDTTAGLSSILFASDSTDVTLTANTLLN